MRTVKQVSKLTGISVRTLQFYDEIGLFKPTQVTQAGYRLYDNACLERLQQILFFKELDFTLKEIKEILENPHFDKLEAFQKQRALLQMKRDRLDGLLGLLERLMKGETVMSFQAFDLSSYFQALDEFRRDHMEIIVQRFGSAEQFEQLVAQMREKEPEIAKMAVETYGSIENYVAACRKNWELLLGEQQQLDVGAAIQKTEALTRALTSDLGRDVACAQVQQEVRALIQLCDESSRGFDAGENHWDFMADQYLTSPEIIKVIDKKYGRGASEYMGRAIKAYLEEK